MATFYRGFFFFFFLFDPFSMPHISYTWRLMTMQTNFQLDWSSCIWDILPQNPWSEFWRFEPWTKSQNLSFLGLSFCLITWIRRVEKIWNSQCTERMHLQMCIVTRDSVIYVLLDLLPLSIGALYSYFFVWSFSMPHRSYTWPATNLKFIVLEARTQVSIESSHNPRSTYFTESSLTIHLWGFILNVLWISNLFNSPYSSYQAKTWAPKKLKFWDFIPGSKRQNSVQGFGEVYLKNSKTNLAEILFASPTWYVLHVLWISHPFIVRYRIYAA